MTSLGIKHLIECHCTLKLYEGKEDHVYHKFPVYSKFDNKGRVIEKIAQCNNCKTLHKVYDICKSDIIRSGKDSNNSSLSIDDLALQLPDKIVNVLKNYQCDISTWEHVFDIIESEAWDQKVVLAREIIEGTYHTKVMIIQNESKIKIETKVINDELIFNT
jgi:hypothetical protein